MKKLKVKYPVPAEERHLYTPTKIPVAWEGGGGYSLGGFSELGDAINQYEKDGTLKEGFKLITIAALNKALRGRIKDADSGDVELIRE